MNVRCVAYVFQLLFRLYRLSAASTPDEKSAKLKRAKESEQQHKHHMDILGNIYVAYVALVTIDRPQLLHTIADRTGMRTFDHLVYVEVYSEQNIFRIWSTLYLRKSS